MKTIKTFKLADNEQIDIYTFASQYHIRQHNDNWTTYDSTSDIKWVNSTSDRQWQYCLKYIAKELNK